ncbi:hypothetical protein [Bosea caraganae]|nr:hypothetical protein [Bosea caraganae]
MKYLEIETPDGSASSNDSTSVDARNVVVLQLSAVGRTMVSARPRVETLAATCQDPRAMPAAREAPATGAPARPSALHWLVQCFGLTGKSLGFGHTFDFRPPTGPCSRPEAADDARGEGSTVAGRCDGGSHRHGPRNWIGQSLAAMRRLYLSWCREAAITRAVQELRRADNAVLRDLGIRDRTEIEFFVRRGLAD